MSWFSRWRTPRSRVPFLVALLVIALALAAGLAREAHQASVSHREVAQNVLRDYVEFASWEFARTARNELSFAFTQALDRSERAMAAARRAVPEGPERPVRPARPEDSVVPSQGRGSSASVAPAVAAPVAPRAATTTAGEVVVKPASFAKEPSCQGCEREFELRSAFRVDAVTGAVMVYGEPLPPAVVQAIQHADVEMRTPGSQNTPCAIVVRRWLPGGGITNGGPGNSGPANNGPPNNGPANGGTLIAGATTAGATTSGPANGATRSVGTRSARTDAADMGEASLVIGLTARRLGPGGPRELFGFVTDRRNVTRLFTRIVRSRPLLPPTLTRGYEGNAALSVRVVDESDDLIYETPGFDPSAQSAALGAAFVAQDRLDRQSGRLAYQIALRPAAADGLVIGGLPRSRLGLVLGLLALTAGLMIAALVQLRREYELARLRSDFVSGVSHELRTPLAQIRMFSETLLLGRVRSDEEARRSLEIIQQESRRLGHLVDNVLHVSKTPHRALRLACERRRLGPLLREVVDAFAPLARARRVTVRFVAQDDVVASVDASALRQIVLNLLDNAVKYGPVGQTVTVTLAAAGTLARITVDDEGPGIMASDAARIWAPFARLPQAIDAGITGAGIGLAVVHELTLRHAGQVSVSTAPAGGARFTVDLPGAAPATALDLAADRDSDPESEPSSEAGADGAYLDDAGDLDEAAAAALAETRRDRDRRARSVSA